MPITSNVSNLYPSEAYITLNGEQRKAMADQLTAVSETRFTGMLCRLSAADMQAIEHSIQVQLGMV